MKEVRAMTQYCRLLHATALSRWLLESLAALALLSWSSDHLLPTLTLYVTLLRCIPSVVFHPAPAFFIGNVLVVTLFTKSHGHSSEAPSSTLLPAPSNYGNVHDQRYCYYFSASIPSQFHQGKEEEVVVHEDKGVCLESINHPTCLSGGLFTERKGLVGGVDVGLLREREERAGAF